MVGGFAAVDEQEFPVVRKGYDKDRVRAYLGEVETAFRGLEQWADEARARLEIAQEESSVRPDVDEAMIAVFAAEDRVMARGRRRADTIEAEARDQARADYEDAATEIIEEAKNKARRIIEAALVTSERFQYESILGEARAEADRIIEEARLEAGRLIEQSQTKVTDHDPASDILVIDLRTENDIQPETANQPLEPSRYERRSAKLPSLGEAAADILKSMGNVRLDENTH